MKKSMDLKYPNQDIIIAVAKIVVPTTYLELGIHKGVTLVQMIPIAKRVIGVDVVKLMPDTSKFEFYKMTTDSFFENVKAGKISLADLDMVFIDAYHSFENCLKDFDNVFPYVSEDGLIFIHDTYPIDIKQCTPNQVGTCYKVTEEIRKRRDICEIITIPCYPGMTLVRKTDGNMKHLVIKDTPKNSIIIPVKLFDNAVFEMTKKCVESIRKHSYDYEIIIIDNGSDKNIRNRYKEIDGNDIRIKVYDKPLGYPRACNMGFRMARGERIIGVNNDVTVSHNWLSIMEKICLENNALVGVSGENLIITEDKITQVGYIGITSRNYAVIQKEFPRECDYIGGSCFMMTREMFKNIGFYDENMGIGYCEDADYGIRAKAKGYKSMVVSLPGFTHAHSFTMKQTVNITERISKNMQYLSYKQTLSDFKKKYFKNVELVTCMVLSWETKDETELCVDSILRERELLKVCGVNMKLIVVDNGSTDGTVEYLKQEKGIDELILNNTNLGISKARNLGIDKREGKYLFMVDSDISIVKGSFIAMLKYMEAHPGVTNIGANPLQITDEWDKQTDFLKDINIVENTSKPQKSISKIWALTQYGIFRTELFEKVKFDESGLFGMPGWGCEDDDLAWYMISEGHSFCLFNDMVYYHCSHSSGKNLEARNIDSKTKERRAYVMNKWAPVVRKFQEGMPDTAMKINVIACCWNEEKMLPFFLDYYSSFCDSIILYDGGSTDRSLEIISKYPKAKVISYDSGEYSDELVLVKIRSERYKEYAKDYDWQIIVDIDEFLYHPDILNLLKQYKEEGVTIPLTDGYEMYSNEFPREEDNLIKTIQYGKKSELYSKNCIFNPHDINIRYAPGSHTCDPLGYVKYSKTAELKFLHYKFLSWKYLIERSRICDKRASEENKKHYMGIHYAKYMKISPDKFAEMLKECVKVL